MMSPIHASNAGRRRTASSASMILASCWDTSCSMPRNCAVRHFGRRVRPEANRSRNCANTSVFVRVVATVASIVIATPLPFSGSSSVRN
jgi:hypothetical protein